MTAEQRQMVETLSRCVTFPVGSTDKRFVRDMAAVIRAHESAKDPPNAWVPLTERQTKYLVDIFHRYRRQHGQCRCEQCEPSAMDATDTRQEIHRLLAENPDVRFHIQGGSLDTMPEADLRLFLADLRKSLGIEEATHV